jgi:hypothetical protein
MVGTAFADFSKAFGGYEAEETEGERGSALHTEVEASGESSVCAIKASKSRINLASR